ncbi:putative T6SS immunity periplasmic lipoprotein [Cronobacter dublinensis]|uniref:putative T6SS immunity periplasmic lipoprotein n=1 Tax=Cronobacter dublinensis TaxID=413497 RepID=UPI000CFD5124|nr:putative T6SS immunity periplasmic lipoprotein [Cronobacter dublinensis]
MKRLLVVVVTGLLTGCPSGADRMLPEEPAAVMARGDTVCLLVANNPDEVIRSVEIYSQKGESLTEYRMPEATRTVARGQCLPDLGFSYRPDNRYSAYYYFQNRKGGPQRLFAAHFATAAHFPLTISATYAHP